MSQVHYNELPNVLIQDSANVSPYYFKSGELKKFEVNSLEDTENTVTFLIPNGDLFDEVSPQTFEENPSILIKFPKDNSQYLIPNNKLIDYKIESFDEMASISNECLTFIIPRGDELLEDIPNMSPAMLQSNTEATEFQKPIQKKQA